MNRTHRVVWSAARGAYVVAHEFASVSGKKSTTKSAVAKSFALATLLVSAPAFSQTVSITAPVGQKSLGPNETLIVTNTGTISSTNTAAAVSGAHVTASAIVNSGSILGNAGAISDGVNISNATLTNGITNSGSTSLISSPSATGIDVNGASSVSTIVNQGTITQVGSFYTMLSPVGVTVHSGASVGSIVNSGAIAGYVAGLIVNGASVGTISNSGSGAVISSGSTAIAVQNGASVGLILNTGTIGQIVSYAGIAANAGTISSITNSGMIMGGISVENGGSIGTIVNLGTASVTRGVTVSSGSIGALNNSGIISSAFTGVIVSGGTISTLSNTGTISGRTNAIQVSAGTVGTIVNAGFISGINGIGVGGGVIDSIVNSGSIAAQQYGINVTGGAVSSISNSGIISGGATYPGGGIFVTNGAIGSVVNTGTINAYVAVWNNYATLGPVTNSGLLEGLFGLASSGTMTSLNNSGTILGGIYGAYFYDGVVTSGITNSGLISSSGSSDGLGLYDLATVTGGITNLAGGTLSGAVGLIFGAATADFISNQAGATISGTFAGIQLLSGATVTQGISNAGAIVGGNFGISSTSSGRSSSGSSISLTLSGGIVNSGLISGTSVAGILLDGSTLSGGIANTKGGTISGGQFGIDLTYTPFTSGSQSSTPTMLTGGIVNSGVISGTSVAGIAVNSVSMSGGITNLKGGTISGGATGISVTNASTVTGGLTNSGVISGGTYSVYVDPTSSLGPITIGGVNSAQFIGDVHALASDVTVSSGSVFSATNVFDVNTFNVAGGGTVILSDPGSTSGGASGITVANGFNNAGTVSVALGTTGVINGAYTQSGSGTYKLGASSVSDYGVLAINGTVDLPKAARIYVDVASDSTLTNKEVLKGVITSSGLTASTFDVTDNLDLVSFTGVIDGNNVDLVTKVNALVLADVIANGNYNAVPAAKVIDEIIASNATGPFTPIIDDLAKLQTSQQVSRTVSQLLPLLSGASNVASIGTMWELDQVIQSRLEGDPGLSSGDDYLTDRGAWVKPFGSWGNQSDQGAAPGFTSNTGGIVLGADGAVSRETRLGVAFAYASSDITGKGADASNENKVDMYQVVGYGSYALDPVTELNFQVDGGGNSNSGHRSIPAFGTNARSSYNSSAAHFGIGLARNMPIDDATTWTPSVRVDYTWARSDSYDETGAGPLDLRVQSASAEQLLTSLDAKITHKVNDYASVFGNVGVGYDSLARNNTQIISAFAGAPGLPFATQGVGLKPWTVLAGFGVVATPQGGPEITVRYDLQDRSSFTEQSFSVKARWAF